jgi:hypothetical protein
MMIGGSGWVTALAGSEVTLVISEGIVGSPEFFSAKDLRPSSEGGCETLVGEKREDCALAGLVGEKREDCALAGLLEVEGDMNGLSSMSAWDRFPSITLRVEERSGVVTL